MADDGKRCPADQASIYSRVISQVLKTDRDRNTEKMLFGAHELLTQGLHKAWQTTANLRHCLCAAHNLPLTYLTLHNRRRIALNLRSVNQYTSFGVAFSFRESHLQPG